MLVIVIDSMMIMVRGEGKLSKHLAETAHTHTYSGPVLVVQATTNVSHLIKCNSGR